MQEELQKEFDALKNSQNPEIDPEISYLIVLSAAHTYLKNPIRQKSEDLADDFNRVEHALKIANEIAKRRKAGELPLIVYVGSKNQLGDLLTAFERSLIDYPKEKFVLIEVPQDAVNTKGQFIALREKLPLEHTSVGLITHAYHYPRLSRMLSKEAAFYPFGQNIKKFIFLVDREFLSPGTHQKIENEIKKIPGYIENGDLIIKPDHELDDLIFMKKKTWADAEIIQAMDANMYLQMTYLAKHVSTMDLIVEDDVTIVRSPIKDDTFNYVLKARFHENRAKERVQYVLKCFQEFSVPFSWWTSVLDTPSDLGRVLESQGLTLKEVNTGMYRELQDFRAETEDLGLILKKVDSEKMMKDFSDIIVSCGGSEKAYEVLFSKIPQEIYQNSDCFEMHVAYLDQLPVVTGILVLHADCAGIYYVATRPDARKKGFGSMMMQHLLERAKERGFTIATLQASHAGKTLYERLGFKNLCEFKEYAPLKDIQS